METKENDYGYVLKVAGPCILIISIYAIYSGCCRTYDGCSYVWVS